MARKTKEQADEYREKIFALRKQGKTFLEIETELDITDAYNLIRYYPPFLAWLPIQKEHERQRKKQEEEAIAKAIQINLNNGLSGAEIKRKLKITHKVFSRICLKYALKCNPEDLRQDRKEYVVSSQYDIFQNALTLRDVGNFKRKVAVGSRINVDFFSTIGIVKAKYRFFADVDTGDWRTSGGYPWSELIIYNRGMLKQ